MIERIYDICLVFLGEELSGEEGSVLSLLCETALLQWTGRLSAQYAPEDCEEVLSMAASFSALANFLAGRETRTSYVSYSAGDVSVNVGEKRGKTIELLRQQAELVMGDYVRTEGFFVQGVSS